MKVRPVRPSFMQGIGLVVHPVNCGVEDQEWELEGRARDTDTVRGIPRPTDTSGVPYQTTSQRTPFSKRDVRCTLRLPIYLDPWIMT